MARIAIIGGHGKVGLRLSRLLTENGHEVTSLFRRPEQEGDVRETGATPRVLDVERASEEEIAAAIEGHDALVWTAGAGGGDPERTYAVDRDAAIRSMGAAARAGVTRYLMVSYLGASLDHDVPEDSSFYPYAEAKAAADAHLRGTELAWAILKPGALTDDEPSGRIAVDPDPETDGKDTSRGNVARVALAVLETAGARSVEIGFVDGGTPIADAVARVAGDAGR